jgi:hypothetical protein
MGDNETKRIGRPPIPETSARPACCTCGLTVSDYDALASQRIGLASSWRLGFGANWG